MSARHRSSAGEQTPSSGVAWLAPPSSAVAVRRTLGAQWRALVALGVLVVVVTGAAAASPRLTAALLADDFQHTVASASPALRDPTAVVTSTETAALDDEDGTTAAMWQTMPKSLADARQSIHPALRRTLDHGHFAGVAAGWSASGKETHGFGGAGTPGGITQATQYRVQASPELVAESELVHGRWPSAIAHVGGSSVIQVVVSEQTATSMQWHLGDVQRFSGAYVGAFRARLVGVVRPRDPHDDFWQTDVNRAVPSVTLSADATPTHHATMFVASRVFPRVAPQLGGTAITGWFDVLHGRLDPDQLPAYRSALNAMLSHVTPIEVTGVALGSLSFQTSLPTMIDLFAARAQASASILAVSATGPLGVAGVTLLLGTTALLRRRRAVRALLRSRGASAVSLGVTAALEVAVASIPGALVGTVLAFLVPGRSAGWTAALVIGGLGPPCIAFCTGAFGAVGHAGGRWTSLVRRRWVLEVLTVVVAAGAVGVVVQRAAANRAADAPASVVDLGSLGHADPLVTATPLLLAAVGVLVLLRVRPAITAAIAKAVRNRGPAAFVGTAEDRRDGSGGGWTLSTVLGATAIGVLAGSVLRSASAAVPPAGTRSPIDASTLVGGLPAVVVAGLVLSAVMVAAAIVLTVTASAPGRQRRGAMLRTLGLTARQRSAVTLWELVPRVVIGVFGGVVLGVLTSVVLVGAILPPGGAHGAASTVLDPLTIVLTATLFALSATLATVAAVISDRRRSGVLDPRSDA